MPMDNEPDDTQYNDDHMLNFDDIFPCTPNIIKTAAPRMRLPEVATEVATKEVGSEEVDSEEAGTEEVGTEQDTTSTDVNQARNSQQQIRRRSIAQRQASKAASSISSRRLGKQRQMLMPFTLPDQVELVEPEPYVEADNKEPVAQLS
ncbi:hypothetical protein HII31_13202 [Pseudocercospora fuligena]|uniref:Uncharacterized protein n=1 Tax=Pseudocercospora fuligena TaxID=685502 RepID=A0A8H6R6I4_9PEZI|nr:hypothetical protein HII31_13202 [Pseudocercospora fuligena]